MTTVITYFIAQVDPFKKVEKNRDSRFHSNAAQLKTISRAERLEVVKP